MVVRPPDRQHRHAFRRSRLFLDDALLLGFAPSYDMLPVQEARGERLNGPLPRRTTRG